MGAWAKLVATVLTYPIQLAQARLRAMKVDGNYSLFVFSQRISQAKANAPKDENGQVKYEYSGTIDVLLKVTAKKKKKKI